MSPTGTLIQNTVPEHEVQRCVEEGGKPCLNHSVLSWATFEALRHLSAYRLADRIPSCMAHMIKKHIETYIFLMEM